MIQSPIVFLSMLFCLFLWQRKAGFLMMDHASLFTETVHPYLPKLYITIYQLLYIAIYRLQVPSFTLTTKVIVWFPHLRRKVLSEKPNKITVIFSPPWVFHFNFA